MNRSNDDQYGSGDNGQYLSPWASSSARQSYAPEEADAPADPLNIPALLRKYWIVLLCLLVLGTGAGFVSVIFTPPLYKVQAMLEIRQPFRPGVQQQESALGIDLQTNIQLLRSNSFVKQVVDRMKTETVLPAPIRSDLFSRLRSRFVPGSKDPDVILNQGLAVAVGTFDVRPINGTRILEVRCESTHPDIAANFVNTLTSEYIAQNAFIYSEQTQNRTKSAQSQLEETKASLSEAEAKLQQFVRQSGNIFVSQDNNTLADTKLRDLQGELSISQKDRIAKQATAEIVNRTSLESLGEVLNDSGLSAYQTRLTELRREIAVLLTTLTPQNPKVVKVQVQIDEIQAAYNKEAAAVKQRVKSEYETALRRERLLTSAYSGQAGQVSSQGAKAAEYNTLRREADIAAQLYNNLLLQASQSNLSNAGAPIMIRVVDAATPPGEPYKPKPAATIALGAIAGIGLCAAIIFLFEKMDRSVKGPSIVRSLIDAPELGVIPSFDSPKRAMLARIPGMRQNALPAPADTEVVPSGELSQWSDRPTAKTESFRQVLASLMRSGLRGQTPPQVLLLTSPGPGEGKTTIVGNLGMALAETHRRTVVIDADFRLPRLHKIFGIPNDRGLTNLLDGRPITASAIQSVLVATDKPHLFVIPNGPAIENISRAVYSTHFRDLLAALRQQFDMILIDAPPLLHAAEARVIDHLTDGVVLVLRAGVTDRESTSRAYQYLREDRAVLLGTILNDWQPAAKTSYYYYSA